jgi:hypothetical protein
MRNDLPRLIRQYENTEFRSNKDVVAYAKLTQTLGEEMYLRMHFHATALEAALKHYKGKWYHFGVTSRVRARIVAAHLRIGAAGCKAWGIAGVKMAASFDKHFVEPERIARGAPKAKKKSTFDID